MTEPAVHVVIDNDERKGCSPENVVLLREAAKVFGDLAYVKLLDEIQMSVNTPSR